MPFCPIKLLLLLESTVFRHCICYSGESHIGYSNDELIGRSWYASIHPDDIERARSKHRECKFERCRMSFDLPSASPSIG